MKLITRFFIVLGILCFQTQPSLAASSDWVEQGEFKARLISNVDSMDEDYAFWGALEIELDKGWHTYWKVAGDAGVPPNFDWSASQNLKAADIAWPAPVRKKELDLVTFGYEDGVVLPIKFNLEEPETQTTLNLKALVLICKDICIPIEFDLSLELPPGNAQPADLDEVKLIREAKKTVPHRGDIPRLKLDTVVAGKDALVLNVYAHKGFGDFDVFAHAPNLPFTAPLEIEVDKDDDRKAMIRIAAPSGIENLTKELEGKALDVTLVSGKDSIEKRIRY